MNQIFREALIASLLLSGVASITCPVAIAAKVPKNTNAARLHKVLGQQNPATSKLLASNGSDSANRNLSNYRIGTTANSSYHENETSKEQVLQQALADSNYNDETNEPQQQDNSVADDATDSMDQVTSVSQLSDVKPTDWAFQAVQSLVERYGCIAGYPDRSFRGNRALTRYEFAAGLNACLNRVNELIAAGTADLVRKEDIATLRRLQEEFAAEITAVRGRVDNLEPRTAQLEANQFSTTTKLVGQVILDVNGGTSIGNRSNVINALHPNQKDPNATFINRTRISFNTSFTGKDKLLTQFQSGVSTADGDDNAGFFYSGGTFSGLDFGGNTPNFRLRRLRYEFPVGKDLQVSAFLRASLGDYVDFNTYANDNARDFSASWAVNDYLVLGGDSQGSGIALTYNPGQGPFIFTAAYRATNAQNPGFNGRAQSGAFGDPYLAAAEITFSPIKTFTARVLYTYGSDNSDRFDAIGFNFEYTIVKSFAIFGRFGHVFDYAPSAIASNFADPGLTSGSVITNKAKPNYWTAGIAFPDLFVPGALAGLQVGEPFIDNSIGNDTEKNLEAFYRYPISDNILITPSFQMIINAGNDNRQGTDYIGSFRTSFFF